MNSRLVSAFSSVLLLLSACASTNFQQYEGRPGSDIVEGQGGTKELLEGYDIWGMGSPPKQYKILGMAEIEDFDNLLGRGRMRDALVKQIKSAGGDAAIVIDASGGGQIIGASFDSKGASSTSVGFGKRRDRYLIVKYQTRP